MDYPEFSVEYPFAGNQWLLTLKAKDFEEAEARLKALAWAKVQGQIYAKLGADEFLEIEKGPDIVERAFFRVADGVFKLLNLYCRARNALRCQPPKP